MAADFGLGKREEGGEFSWRKRRLSVQAGSGRRTLFEKMGLQLLTQPTEITVSLFIFDKQWYTC